jgi:benzoate/toluate 1,2-dioxygenase subunit beta
MTAAAQHIVDGTPPPAQDGVAPPVPPDVQPLGISDAERFLYREARLADAWELDAWEALWTDDALYHVPIDEHADPFRHMSIIFDNRGRIATRIKQLHTGRRHAQRPPSSLVRAVTNVEILGVADSDPHDTIVGSVVSITEARDRDTRHFTGRVTHRLRRVPTTDGTDGLRMSMKKILLVDAHKPLLSLSFLV